MLRSIINMAGNQNGGPSTMTPVRRSNENERPPHPGKRIPSSKFTEYPASVEDKISLDFKEAFVNVQPSTSDDGPKNTNKVEHFNKLLANLEAEDRDEKPVVEDTEIGTSRSIPDVLLQTDVLEGLNDTEVKDRRSTYGPNQLKEHEHSYIKHFASFFVSPIQFAMIVSLKPT